MSFLTDAELHYLTELKQPAAQIRWLQKWRIRHTISAAGNPRVTWESVNGSEKPRKGPKFEALEKAG